jgi:hypothetical protein
MGRPGVLGGGRVGADVDEGSGDSTGDGGHPRPEGHHHPPVSVAAAPPAQVQNHPLHATLLMPAVAGQPGLNGCVSVNLCVPQFSCTFIQVVVHRNHTSKWHHVDFFSMMGHGA